MTLVRRLFLAAAAAIVPSASMPARDRAQNRVFSETPVTFRNDSVDLSGTLIIPRTDGPHPAVVFLHGSGPATRTGARPYAERFADLGIASLIFDKRGSGASGGFWTTASLADLAADALAAVAFLKGQNGVDPHRIGFWGVSQAGWVATLAAARSPDVSFMIVISGGGASPHESELFAYRRAFQRAHLSPTDTAQAMRVITSYFEYLATGRGREGLVAMLDSAHGSPWYPYASLDRILPDEANRHNWSWVATWDPAPFIEKITCPVLLMFGDRDDEHPSALAVRRWRAGLAKAGNRHVRIEVFPGAGHGIRMRDGFTGPGRPPFADGYEERMLEWLRNEVVGTSQRRQD